MCCSPSYKRDGKYRSCFHSTFYILIALLWMLCCGIVLFNLKLGFCLECEHEPADGKTKALFMHCTSHSTNVDTGRTFWKMPMNATAYPKATFSKDGLDDYRLIVAVLFLRALGLFFPIRLFRGYEEYHNKRLSKAISLKTNRKQKPPNETTQEVSEYFTQGFGRRNHLAVLHVSIEVFLWCSIPIQIYFLDKYMKDNFLVFGSMHQSSFNSLQLPIFTPENLSCIYLLPGSAQLTTQCLVTMNVVTEALYLIVSLVYFIFCVLLILKSVLIASQFYSRFRGIALGWNHPEIFDLAEKIGSKLSFGDWLVASRFGRILSDDDFSYFLAEFNDCMQVIDALYEVPEMYWFCTYFNPST